MYAGEIDAIHIGVHVNKLLWGSNLLLYKSVTILASRNIIQLFTYLQLTLGFYLQ